MASCGGVFFLVVCCVLSVQIHAYLLHAPLAGSHVAESWRNKRSLATGGSKADTKSSQEVATNFMDDMEYNNPNRPASMDDWNGFYSNPSYFDPIEYGSMLKRDEPSGGYRLRFGRSGVRLRFGRSDPPTLRFG